MLSSGKLAKSKQTEKEQMLTIIGEEENSLMDSTDKMVFIDPSDAPGLMIETDSVLV